MEEELDFTFDALLSSILDLASRSLPLLVPLFFGLVGVGFGLDYFFLDSWWSGILLAVLQFVISYFLVKGLALQGGLMEEGSTGPGFAAYFGLSFVMGLGVGLGLLLLVIPGIVLTVRWILAFPVLFSDEERGFGSGALQRSWDLTSKIFWKLLGAYMFSICMMGVSIYAYSYVGFALQDSTSIAALAVANAAAALSTIFNILLGFAAFHLLRTDKADLSQVFS